MLVPGLDGTGVNLIMSFIPTSDDINSSFLSVNMHSLLGCFLGIGGYMF